MQGSSVTFMPGNTLHSRGKWLGFPHRKQTTSFPCMPRALLFCIVLSLYLGGALLLAPLLALPLVLLLAPLLALLFGIWPCSLSLGPLPAEDTWFTFLLSSSLSLSLPYFFSAPLLLPLPLPRLFQDSFPLPRLFQDSLPLPLLAPFPPRTKASRLY